MKDDKHPDMILSFSAKPWTPDLYNNFVQTGVFWIFKGHLVRKCIHRQGFSVFSQPESRLGNFNAVFSFFYEKNLITRVPLQIFEKYSAHKKGWLAMSHRYCQ